MDVTFIDQSVAHEFDSTKKIFILTFNRTKNNPQLYKAFICCSKAGDFGLPGKLLLDV